MWRAFFLAVGISLCIVGAEGLVIEKAVLDLPEKGSIEEQAYLQMPSYLQPMPQQARNREVKLPEWAPWTLLSAGSVVVLYSMTVARA